MTAVNLPYHLREGQRAYAAKVMANFEALLGAYNLTEVKGLGVGDIPTLLRAMFEAAIKANETNNASQIYFEDGENLTDKFNAGNLNASIVDADGLFYFYVDPVSGHLMLTCADDIEEDAFTIGSNGHLLYTIADPDDEDVTVHTYDLGQVRGPQGIPGVSTGNMSKSVYDPNEREVDMNTYTGHFKCWGDNWGGYYLTYDELFSGDKTYYTLSGSTYSAATVTTGAEVPVNQYYEKLGDNEYLLTDGDAIAATAYLSDHITDMSGHAIVAASMDASDEAKVAWNSASVTAVAQGEGMAASSGADNTSSWIKLRALGIVPSANDIALTVVLYQ